MPHVVRDLATLRLRTSSTEASLTIDGVAVPGHGADREVPLDPGSHTAVVSAPGAAPQHFDFALAPGSTVEQSVVFVQPNPDVRAPAAKPETPPTRTPVSINSVGPWVLVGLGGALLVGGAVTGLLASRADGEFSNACPSLQNCDLSLRDTRDRALSLGRAADILFASGGTVLAGGIAWRIFAPGTGPTRSGQAVAISVSGTY
jgi:hypothetical protein